MIIFLYCILLLAFLFLEKVLSDKDNRYGLIFGIVVVAAGFILCSQLKYIGIILCGVNFARTCLSELKLMDLTTIKRSYHLSK